MAYFTNRIAVTEAGSVDWITSTFGEGNGIASNDQKTWGSALNTNNNRARLEYSKQYLNFTFEIERSSVNEFAYIEYGKMELYNINNEKVWEFSYNPFGAKTGMYSSQANELLNWIVKSDDNMLIRASIDTHNNKNFYKISEIKKIYCQVKPKSQNVIEKTWDLTSNDTLIYQSCKWNSDGNKDTIQFSNQYTQKLISPKLNYSGTIKIYSKVYGSNNETSCGTHYFLGTNNGKIRMTMSDVQFFGASAKNITKLFFSGVDTSQNKKEHSITVTFDNETPTAYEFSSSNLSGFSKIDSISVCFGNNNNKIPISSFSGNFLNTEIESNMRVKFQQTSGINNKNIEITEKGNPIKAREELSGTLTLDSDYPYVLQENSYVTLVSDKEYKLQEDQNFKISSLENGVLTINYGHDYGIEENDDKETLNINTVCKLKTGKYNLKYDIINKLNVISNEKKNHTFTFVSGHEIKISTNAFCYIAFDDSSSNIKYPHNNIWYNVNGIIIIPNEEIVFSNVPHSANEARIYKLAVGETEAPNKYIQKTKISHIGLHEDFHSKNLQRKLISELSKTTEGELRIGYDDLESWFFEEDSYEQKTLYLSNIVSTTGGNISASIYTQPKKYILGRIKTPIYDGLKVENKKIKYFLTDNGCDQIISSNSKKFQNDFINKRINNTTNEADFSISRNLGAKYAKERLRLSIFREQDQIGNFLIKIKTDNKTTRETSNTAPYTAEFYLNEALYLLKTNQINKIDINGIIDKMSINDQGKQDLKDTLESAPFDLKISPEYVYNEDNDIYQELFSIHLLNINLSPDVIPIGLRKDGVIINPKEGGNEKLNETDSTDKKNTLVVNVNNVTKLDGGKYEDINGLKISFSNPKIDNGVQSLQEVAYFEIFLNSNGEICFSNGIKTFKPFN